MMPYICMDEHEKTETLHYEHQKSTSPTRVRGIRSKQKKKSNVVIIVEGENAEEIKKELLLAVRKLARKKELGYYITPVEVASLRAIQEFADLSLEVSAEDRI